MRSTLSIPSIRAVRRVIAVTLTLLLTLALTGSGSTAAAADTGGDFGACDDGLWQKADWNSETDSWDWEVGPGWDGDAPTAPSLDVTSSNDDDEPMTVDWTSTTYVESVSVKASTQHETFDGGYSGTVTGIGNHAISHIVFCYGPETPPAPTGSLTVVKEVIGDHEGGAFDFAGTCQLPQFPAHATFSLADGDSWTFPEEIPGYLDGTPCQFEETDANGADGVSYHLGQTELTPDADGRVHFTLSSTEDLVLTVTNTFVPSSPEVVLEKAWFADDDDTSPIAIFRKVDGEWVRVDDGAPFTQPDGFDLTVSYGEETYTVAETLPAGWQAIDCPAEAPDPNGLGTFPYERPTGDDAVATRGELEVIRHGVCNAPVPVPPPTLVPSIEVDKTADPGLVTYDPEGDPQSVAYTYTVTNTGQTRLTDVTLVDDVLGTITLTDTDLAVGESTTGTATHVVTAADADEGQIVNTAEVTGTAPDQTTVTDTATATVLVEEVAPAVEARSEVTLEKTALVTPDQDGRKVVTWNEAAPTGTEVTYEYVITNTGETPLTAITLVDDVLGTITLTDTDLAVGESMTVTAVHTVTEADADAGSITNEATTTATDPEGTEVTDAAVETVLVAEVQGDVVDEEPEPSVVDEEPEPSVRAKKEEQLPVTGAATTVLAVLAALSLAAGAGLLRRYPGRP